ncbi:putative RNA methyltransferase [Shewanella algae]|uniref:putative RNA methyltransferase n=1 Tax=Shewanella algae TaxID=38313 RepID=UPI001AACCC39|nr:SAM-dependent methyltransferase [Shewanella algae]MBO2671851.1 SAM-dependent methyltransferase [Shewanella algae]
MNSVQFQCPVCQSELKQHQASRGFYCANKHHFDRQEDGYWLLAKPKSAAVHALSRQALRARRFLLQSELMEPLHQALNLKLARLAENCDAVLDPNAGDGALQQMLQLPDELQRLLICDAQNAAFAAAKALPTAQVFLSVAKRLPFEDAQFSLVTLLDGQLKGKEIPRVMKPGAHLVMLAPGPRHLWQVREQLNADLKQREFSISLPAELTVLETESLSFSLDVSGEQALTLLETTPYAWRASEKQKRALATRAVKGLELDYRVLVIKRN